MALNNYIKKLIQEVVNEESATGDIGVGAGPIATPKWANPKKKMNEYNFSLSQNKLVISMGLSPNQIQTLQIIINLMLNDENWVSKAYPEGYTADDVITGLNKIFPKDIKAALDTMGQGNPIKYTNLLKSEILKKKGIDESNYDMASPSSRPSDYLKASPSSNPSLYLSEKNQKPINETIMDIVKEELLKESSYNKFRNEVKFRSKSDQLHKAIREVKRKISEIDRIVEYTVQMKQELSEGEEGIKYWKSTQSNINNISEMITNLNNKIKTLHQ